MAGVSAGLPAGVRLSDHISLGVIARAFPPDQVRQVLSETGRASERERDLPAQVMVYYAIALALYMGSSTREVLRCLLEGLRWLWGAEAVKVAGRSGISQARTRLGEAPLHRLYEQGVRPIATHATMITMRAARASSTRAHCCSCVVGKQLNRYCSRFRARFAYKAPVRCRSGVARQLSQPPSWLQARHRRADEGGLAHGAAVLGPSPAPRTPVGRRPIPDSG